MSLKKHAKSFYFASLFLSTTAAKRASDLYQVCRLLDDIVDNRLHPDPISALDTISTRINALSKNDVICISPDNFVQKAPLLQLIDGVQSDATFTPYHSLEALLAYCYQVAGTVGIMMCDILGVHHPNAYKHAVDLGVAMQLTNICRDVYKDAKLGRVYLPYDHIGTTSPEAILFPNDELVASIARAIHTLMDVANRSYQSGYYGLSYIPRSERLAIFIAGKLYHAIHSRIQPYSIEHTARIPSYQKLSIALHCCMNFYQHPLHLFDSTHTPESLCTKYALADV